MKRTYQLTITIDERGEINATERMQGMSYPEVIGLLEMQKNGIIQRLQSTTITMPNIGFNNHSSEYEEE